MNEQYHIREGDHSPLHLDVAVVESWRIRSVLTFRARVLSVISA